MNVEIQRADRSLRRRTFMVLSAAVLAAVLLMILLHGWMGRAARTLPEAQFVFEMRRMTGFAVTGCGLCVMLLAAYAARLALRVTLQQRWPLRGARVMQDTRVRSGADAMAMARMLNMAAIGLIALAIGFAILSWRLFGAA